MKKLNGPERVTRARRNRELMYWIHDMACDVWNAITTALMFVGIGGCIGVGCGCGLAIIVSMI